MNKMQETRIEKITLNIGMGQPGEKLEKSMKLLERIANSKPIKTITMKRIPTWGIRPRLVIGSKVTIHGKKAEELLVRLLQAIDNSLTKNMFDEFGNFSFGIKEYIDIPGIEYDSELGIIGLEVAVTLKKPGYRVSKRRLSPRKIPSKHRVQKGEAISFIKTKFNVMLKDEAEEILV